MHNSMPHSHNNIINIINFIRGAEPRDRSIDLVEPVRQQIALMQKHHLPGTFLVQYDAMMRQDMLDLIQPLDPDQFELGLWFELNQPHTQAAGLPWRGQPGREWDWTANVGFSVGYTRSERRRLADAMVAKFQQCFGRKPLSVGSWMLDAYTLAYLADEHGIIASCNCKDQWGTDGYTIWGGYWNQGYYPSRQNVLCPAQSIDNQIPAPVFRMLGSDPVSQYDLGLSIQDGARDVQLVASLEPVYRDGGGDPRWVDWFMRQNFCGGSLALAYAQAGQENSFGWQAMSAGLTYQFAAFEQWRDQGKLRVERLMDTGRWFRERFPLTPATAVSALEPYGDRNAQSVWYNCRNYRANVCRDDHGLRLRDMTLFDENYPERYLDAVCDTEYLVYDNLPIMDGNRMSGGGILAGAWVCGESGEPLTTSPLAVTEGDASLTASFGSGSVIMDEAGITLTGGACLCLRWRADKSACVSMQKDALAFEWRGVKYRLAVKQGHARHDGSIIICPDGNQIRIEPQRGATPSI